MDVFSLKISITTDKRVKNELDILKMKGNLVVEIMWCKRMEFFHQLLLIWFQTLDSTFDLLFNWIYIDSLQNFGKSLVNLIFGINGRSKNDRTEVNYTRNLKHL